MSNGNAILVVAIIVTFVGWFVPSWLVATYAEKKGHSFWGFFLLSIFTSWLIGLIGALLVKDRETHESTIRCPSCAEPILAAANVCKHCGHQVRVSVPA
jgi:hypothetical protein